MNCGSFLPWFLLLRNICMFASKFSVRHQLFKYNILSIEAFLNLRIIKLLHLHILHTWVHLFLTREWKEIDLGITKVALTHRESVYWGGSSCWLSSRKHHKKDTNKNDHHKGNRPAVCTDSFLLNQSVPFTPFSGVSRPACISWMDDLQWVSWEQNLRQSTWEVLQECTYKDVRKAGWQREKPALN